MLLMGACPGRQIAKARGLSACITELIAAARGHRSNSINVLVEYTPCFPPMHLLPGLRLGVRPCLALSLGCTLTFFFFFFFFLFFLFFFFFFLLFFFFFFFYFLPSTLNRGTPSIHKHTNPFFPLDVTVVSALPRPALFMPLLSWLVPYTPWLLDRFSGRPQSRADTSLVIKRSVRRPFWHAAAYCVMAYYG